MDIMDIAIAKANIYGTNANNYGAIGVTGAETGNSASIGAALTSMSNTGLLTLRKGTYLIDVNLTIPSGVVFDLPKGVILKVANGVALTINGEIKAGFYQWLDLSLGGTVAGTLVNEQIHPAWFASTVTTAAINSAIAMAAGKSVIIPTGTIALAGGTITVNTSCTLKGYGILSNGIISVSTNDVEIRGLKTTGVVLGIGAISRLKIIGNKFKDKTSGDVYGYIYSTNSFDDVVIQNNDFDNIAYGSSSTTYGCGMKFELGTKTVSNLKISNNRFSNIYGPAAIWFGGGDNGLTTILNKVIIQNNQINDTYSFGIELYKIGSGTLKFNDSIIKHNEIFDTGKLRPNGTAGNGSGGIYSNLGLSNCDIRITKNTIKRITEIGIEGSYKCVDNNYIEDTGCDQLNRVITDSAGIYGNSRNVLNNTIINPGNHGGIYYYTSGVCSNMVIKGNVTRHDFNFWTAGTTYVAGDLVVANNNWYICTTGGVAGATKPVGITASISDDTCIWDYKKPFSNYGIYINATGGNENIVCSENTAVEFSSPYAFSKWNTAVVFRNNGYVNNKIDRLTYLNGSGVAGFEKMIYERPYFRASAVPATGTWIVGDRIENHSISAGGYSGWYCMTSGSFLTLAGKTGSVGTGLAALTVNDPKDFKVGQVISIAGVTGNKTITAISGVVLTIDSTSDATVTNAAITYVPTTAYASLTGSIASGGLLLTPNDITDFKVGQYIAIVGVSGTKKIVTVNSTTLTLDTVSNATVTDAAITYVAPTFKGYGLVQA